MALESGGKMHAKILVIDDDPGLVTLLCLGLERNGFEVFSATDGKEGLRMAYEAQPDAIILDIIMPGLDGWTVCQRLRAMSDAPIILLTAKNDQRDVVHGLSLGADDYVTKPCSFDELRARLHTAIRRARSARRDTWERAYDDGHLRINLADGTVVRDGREINLTPIESRMLSYLVSQRGRVVPHQELLAAVWGPEYESETDYLSVYICYLRRKIEDDPSNPRYIHTRWGKGYMFLGCHDPSHVQDGQARV